MDKLAMLSEIVAANPKDAFARYGLAMEHASRGSVDQALAEFTTLTTQHPDYTPGYFMAAQTLAKAGRTQDARTQLIHGIESAKRTGNRHAVSEMEAMLDEIDLA